MRAVVCFKDTKLAALYFDRVIPVAFKRLQGTGSDIVIEFPEPIPSRALVNIVFDQPPSISEGDRYQFLGRVVDGWHEFQTRTRRYRSWENSVKSSVEDEYADIQLMYLRNDTVESLGSIRNQFSSYAKSLGAEAADVLIPDGFDGLSQGPEEPTVTIAKIPLINPASASWEQIVEIRTDPSSRASLQRMRSFLSTNYTDKPRAFIEDDLASRIDDYSQAAKKHGLDMAISSVSTLLDAKNLHAAAAAGIVSTFAGGPVAGLTAAVVVEVAGVSLELARQQVSIRDWKSRHELAYLIKVMGSFPLASNPSLQARRP